MARRFWKRNGDRGHVRTFRAQTTRYMLVLILVLVVYNTHTIHVIPTLFYTSPRSLSLLIDGEDAVELLMAANHLDI